MGLSKEKHSNILINEEVFIANKWIEYHLYTLEQIKILRRKLDGVLTVSLNKFLEWLGVMISHYFKGVVEELVLCFTYYLIEYSVCMSGLSYEFNY